MINRLYLRLFVLLTVTSSFVIGFAHETIVGKVLSKNNNLPIWGATVIVNGTSVGTTTDELGKFSLIIDAVVDSITISYLGYKPTTVAPEHGAFNTFYLERGSLQLNEIKINPNNINTEQIISAIDIQLNPVNSSQEVLRQVPGLFIGQHAGGGKAEQIFLRGYDIDHGTDLNLSVDGMPVNMVSHAHGQGYSDLHFLIPELIAKVKFQKGPFYSDYGNFASTGYVDFSTINKLDRNVVKLEAGRFNTFRMFGAVDLLKYTVANESKQDAFIATEYLTSDGPFESPQDFKRLNLMYKHTYRLTEKVLLRTQLSHFRSEWNASGQIPASAVENGIIGRFGAIDDDEGGNTDRTNALIHLQTALNSKSFFQTNAFYSHYNFTLFSNFTFFLEDTENGDRIKQQEKRNIYGLNTTYNYNTSLNKVKLTSKIGVGVRYDQVDDNELSQVLGRDSILEQFAFGNVDETNAYLFASQDFIVNKFSFNIGARADLFNFRYLDKLNNNSQDSRTVATINPKITTIYNVTSNSQIFAKVGMGYHSNDTRSVFNNQSAREILPRVYGADVGANFKLFKKIFVSTTGWVLKQEDELVYVGDAGIVESNGQSLRLGVEISARVQLLKWLFAESNFSYTKAQSLESPENENRIPLAPVFTSTGGLYVRHNSGFNGSFTYRFLSDRPANEDNSLIAEGYTVVDLNLAYTQKKYEIGLVIENLFNTEWREAQFETESRITPEAEPTNEIHFTPGTPIFIRGKVAYYF